MTNRPETADLHRRIMSAAERHGISAFDLKLRSIRDARRVALGELLAAASRAYANASMAAGVRVIEFVAAARRAGLVDDGPV